MASSKKLQGSPRASCQKAAKKLLWTCLTMTAALLQSCSSDENTDASAKASAPPLDVAALQAGVEAGDVKAINDLGQAYLEGSGVEQDYAKAAALLQQAAEKGHADAQAHLAMLYDAGQGVTADPMEALKWFKQAADQNHAIAAYNLGSIYGAGRPGVPVNIPESTKWYMLSAQLGDGDAQYNVAQRYHIGVGVPIDLVEAYKWYELSARRGVPDAAVARDKLKKELSRQQVQEAMKRVEEWQPKESSQ